MEMTERNKDAPTQLDKSPDLEVPNNDMVICPKCVHQFRAIPVNVQHELADERVRREDAEIALRRVSLSAAWNSNAQEIVRSYFARYKD